MRTLLFLLLATCFPLSQTTAKPPGEDGLATAEPPRPNVILIFIDDMGFGDVEFNGGTAAKTPNLNRMAKEGRRFHDFYVGCAVCSGSRTALMTGCHYQRLSMSAVLFPNSKNGLHPDEVTLADMLKDTGYKTACIGKWHLGHLPPCLPTYQGFESYYGIPYSNDMWIDPANKLAKDLVVREGLTREEVAAGHRKRNWVPLMRNEEVIEYPVEQSTVTKRYTEEAIRFIESQSTNSQSPNSTAKPFFLYLPHTMVHLPLAVSEKFKSIFDGKTLKGWKATSKANWRVEDGAIVVDDGERGFLLHKDTYENYELALEFKAAKGTNSGVFLNTTPKQADVAKDCYELNIAPPDNPFPTGSLVGRKKFEGAGETHLWRKFEVRVEKGHVKVRLDGQQVIDYKAETPASGNRIGLQLNSGRVAFRHIRVRKLP